MRKWKIETLEALKAKGYVYIAAVVKVHYANAYYNVQKIDDIIENGGKWIAAWRNGMYAVGVESRTIDWNVTILRKNVKDGE